jgi:hypothetical protein
MYQQKTGQPAAMHISLELPALIGWNEDEASTAVRQFTAKNSPFLTAIQGTFSALISETATAGQKLELADSWDKLLSADFPEERFGRIPINFYLFRGLPCSTLIGKASGSQSAGNNGLLAVVG